jgi:hypothetical protein
VIKARYGDYPWHDSNSGDYPTTQVDPNGQQVEVDVTSVMLLYALTGRLKLDPQATEGPVFQVSDSLEDDKVKHAPKFIDISKFTYSVDNGDNPGALLDPWGNPYIYWYKWEDTPTKWDVFGYHLYSTGPDGEVANDAIKEKIDETTGVFNKDFRQIADSEGIIFSGE